MKRSADSKPKQYFHICRARLPGDGRAEIGLRVKLASYGSQTVSFQVEVPPALLVMVDGADKTAAFTCVEYREMSERHYSAPDWLARYKRANPDVEDADAELIASNDRASRFQEKVNSDAFQWRVPTGIVDPAQGSFGTCGDYDASKTRLTVHSFSVVECDRPEEAGTLTVPRPLTLVLRLLLETSVQDSKRNIGGSNVTSVWLECRSV